jgi:hypothetical protein
LEEQADALQDEHIKSADPTKDENDQHAPQDAVFSEGSPFQPNDHHPRYVVFKRYETVITCIPDNSRSGSRGRNRKRSYSPQSRSPPRRRSRSPFRGRRRSQERRYDQSGERGSKPLMSFKAFIQQQDDHSAPEVYQQRYESEPRRHFIVARLYFSLKTSSLTSCSSSSSSSS